MLRLLSRHIDIQTNGEQIVEDLEPEPVMDGTQSSYAKRPVSMYEQREGPYMTKMQQIPECRTTTSMYQMIDPKYGPHSVPPSNGDGSNMSLPRSDEVKYRTEIVTRRIQELWNVMQQDMTAKDAFVPCAERIRMAVADLTAIFPVVSVRYECEGENIVLNLIPIPYSFSISIFYFTENRRSNYFICSETA